MLTNDCTESAVSYLAEIMTCLWNDERETDDLYVDEERRNATLAELSSTRARVFHQIIHCIYLLFEVTKTKCTTYQCTYIPTSTMKRRKIGGMSVPDGFGVLSKR